MHSPSPVSSPSHHSHSPSPPSSPTWHPEPRTPATPTPELSLPSDVDVQSLNFRQVGVRRQGRLARGPPARFRQTVPSIPAKFETILLRGARERRGFSSQAARFGRGSIGAGAGSNGAGGGGIGAAGAGAQAPGPGAYLDPSRSSVLTDRSRESFSRRGYGGFASKTLRFGQSVLGPPPKRPGPGQYNVPRRVGEARGSYSKRGTAAFSDTSKREAALRVPGERDGPGPGEYQSIDDRERRAVRRVPRRFDRRKPFASSEERFKDHAAGRADIAPAPGSYDPVVPSDAGTLAQRRSQQPSAAFRDKSRRTDFTRSSDPAAPGPGAYSIDRSITRNRPKAGRMFNAHRVARARPKRKNDEPKAQVPVESRRRPSARKGPSSVFRSRTERIKFNDARTPAPGPAYYSVKEPSSRRSFHLNTQNEWT